MSADRLPPKPHDDPPAPSFSVDTNSAGNVPADVVPAADVAAAGLPVDPLTAQVARALEQPPPQRTWLQSAVLLGITLLLFAGAGFFQNTLTDLVLLVAILLFHESGHYLGMRLFNYQDVRMFFIPFFGAAVSGRSTSVEGYKEAIVLLLGPLPGIALGTALGIVCLFYDSALLRSATLMLLALNGFNLLPLMPLDGGRLLHLIVFSRQRHVEAVFRVVTAVLLGLCAWALGAWLLGILAVFMLLGIQFNFYVSKLAQQLRGPVEPGKKMNLSEPIPREQVVPLIERVRATFPSVVQAPTLANIVRQVWERMHLRPPGVLASLVLLMIYAGSFLGTPIVAALLHMPMRSVVSHPRKDGTPGRRQEVRMMGRLQRSTELGADGRFDGRHVEYDLLTGRVTAEGTYADGVPHGFWTYYEPDGKVKSRAAFLRGKQMDVPLPR